MTPDPDSVELPPGTVVSRSPYLTSGGLAVFDGKTIAVSDLDCFRLHAGASVKALDVSRFVFDPTKPIDFPLFTPRPTR